MFEFLQDINNYEERKVARDEVCGVEVSTVYTSDEGYETALCDANGVHPVQRYETREDAQAGHIVWMEKAKTVTRVVELGGFGGWVDDDEIDIVRINQTANNG